jgi:hypothetical protein
VSRIVKAKSQIVVILGASKMAFFKRFNDQQDRHYKSCGFSTGGAVGGLRVVAAFQALVSPAEVIVI